MTASEKPAEDAARGRQQRRTDLTRSRLLDAALAVMIERGYDAASLGEVTERADLGTGTLYLHFRDKRALYEAVVRRDLEGIYRRWLEIEEPERKPKKKARSIEELLPTLRRGSEATIRFFAEHPERARLYLLIGPPVETWFVVDAGKTLAEKFGGGHPQAEILAHLTIGAAFAICRYAAQRPGEHSVEQLVEMLVAYGSAGAKAVVRE